MASLHQAGVRLSGSYETLARAYHQLRHDDRSPEHKYWNFENCPAPHCVNARRQLAEFNANLAAALEASV